MENPCTEVDIYFEKIFAYRRRIKEFQRDISIRIKEIGLFDFQDADEVHASPTDCNRRRGKLNIFLNPGAYIEAEFRIFPSPRA